MKKIIALAMGAVVAVSMFAACGSFTCDLCGQEKTGEKHEFELLGVEVVYCDDCYNLGF